MRGVLAIIFLVFTFANNCFANEEVTLASFLNNRTSWRDNTEQCDKFINEGEAVLERDSLSDVQLFELNDFLGALYEYKGQYDKAASTWRSALISADKSGLSKEYLSLLLKLGEGYAIVGNMDKAFEVLEESFIKVREYDLPEFEPEIYSLYGILYGTEGKPDSAVKFLKKAVNLFQLQDSINYHSMIPSIINVGMYNLEMFESDSAQYLLDSALLYFSKAQEISRRVGLEETANFSGICLCEVYTLLNKMDEARDCLASKDTSSYSGQNKALFFDISTTFYIANKAYNEALACIYKGIEIDKIQNEYLSIENYYNKLIEIHSVMDNPDSALYYSGLLIQLKDSLDILSVDNQREKQEVIIKLSKQKEISNWQLIIIVIAILFAIAAFILFLKEYKHKKALSHLHSNWEKEINVLARKNTELSLNLAGNKNLSQKLLKSIKASTYDLQDEERDKFVPIMRLLKDASKGEFWKSFEFYFSKVHKDFFPRIESKFSDLTPTEKRLCAFIKMSLSTKDIAALTYRSDQTIEKQRSRLRSKFGISNQDVSLGAFIRDL